MRCALISACLIAFVTAAAAAVLPLLAADIPAAPANAAGTWEAAGVLADACQCSVFCPCEFSERPTFGHCDDAAILNLETGRFGNVTLDGLRVLVVSQSPHGERLVDSVGRLTFAHIYVSKESTDEQMRALAEIARRTFGVFEKGVSRISPKEIVERRPMTVKIEPYHYSARIPDLLDLDIEAILGGDGKTPMTVSNHLFNPLGLSDPMIAHSKTYTYKRGPIDWNYGGRSASIRKFKISGEINPAPEAGSSAGSSELAPSAPVPATASSASAAPGPGAASSGHCAHEHGGR